MWAVHTGFPHDKHGIRLHVVYTVCCGEYSYYTLEVGRGAILKQSCRKHFESTFKEPKVTSAHEIYQRYCRDLCKRYLKQY
jgi:hypothetical protein